MGMVDLMNSTHAMKITGISVDRSVPANADIPLFNLGDINGDGIGDIAVASRGGQGELHVIFGDATPPSTIDASTLNGANGGFKVWTDANHDIVGAGVTGDFNGDGFDDFAIAAQSSVTPNDVDIFVVYGGDTVGGTGMGWGDLTNAAKAFHMTYTIPNGADISAFNIQLSAAGDMNGDGYYDLVIGLPNVDTDPAANSDGAGGADDDNDGASMVVYGRDATNIISAANEGTAGSDSLTASGIDQSLIGGDGNDTLNDGGNADIVFRGGAGADTIQLTNGNFNDIDGGGGNDVISFLQASGTLDFSSFSAEEITRIEGINLSATSQVLHLTLQNIFDLMHGSDNGTLKISSANTGNTLQIDDLSGGSQAGADVAQITNFLGADSATDITTAWSFAFGSYTLEIDKNLLDPGTNNNVNIV
jgi:hypothetical protein